MDKIKNPGNGLGNWVVVSRDMVSQLICDSRNIIYIGGNFFNELTIDKSKIKSFGNQDIFVAQVNVQGEINDFWNLGGNGFDQLSTMCTTTDNCLVLGRLNFRFGKSQKCNYKW